MSNAVAGLARWSSGLRVRLFLLVVVTCVPLIVLTLDTAWEDRRRAKAGWRQKARTLGQQLSREEGKVVGATRQLLVAMAESAPVKQGNARASQKLMDHLFGSYPRYANLGVLLTNGAVLASALPVADNQSNRIFFQRVMESRGFSVGRLSVGEGRLNFGFPVLDRSGQVKGVVFAALDLDWVGRTGSEIPGQLPREATFAEVDRSGVVLARYGSQEARPNELPPEQNLAAAAFAQRRGSLVARDRTGVPRFYSFAVVRSPLAQDDVAVILGIPTRSLFAEADRALARNLGWLVFACALAFLLGWIGSSFLVVRPVRALVQTSSRLAAGDLAARTGLQPRGDELGKLTAAFDQMAAALELREHEREAASRKLQALSRRLVEAQESERRRIARELHDEVGQSLTAAEMNLQAALQDGGTQPSQHLRTASEVLQRVLDQVHDLCLDLRPSMLDDLGLEPALRWYTHRQAELLGISVEFHADAIDFRLDPMIETECFRVAQEALTNVVRHSGARRLTVEMTRADGFLHLRVKDDGAGFDLAQRRLEVVQAGRLGLLGMEERAGLAGGGFQLRTAPGQGTEVHAWFPVRPRLLAPKTDSHE
jgi:signal transduction histidine kinase